ncbi:MAG: flagellar hook-length control protein FliK [bacterium]
MITNLMERASRTNMIKSAKKKENKKTLDSFAQLFAFITRSAHSHTRDIPGASMKAFKQTHISSLHQNLGSDNTSQVPLLTLKNNLNSLQNPPKGALPDLVDTADTSVPSLATDGISDQLKMPLTLFMKMFSDKPSRNKPHSDSSLKNSLPIDTSVGAKMRADKMPTDKTLANNTLVDKKLSDKTPPGNTPSNIMSTDSALINMVNSVTHELHFPYLAQFKEIMPNEATTNILHMGYQHQGAEKAMSFIAMKNSNFLNLTSPLLHYAPELHIESCEITISKADIPDTTSQITGYQSITQSGNHAINAPIGSTNKKVIDTKDLSASPETHIKIKIEPTLRESEQPYEIAADSIHQLNADGGSIKLMPEELGQMLLKINQIKIHQSGMHKPDNPNDSYLPQVKTALLEHALNIEKYARTQSPDPGNNASGLSGTQHEKTIRLLMRKYQKDMLINNPDQLNGLLNTDGESVSANALSGKQKGLGADNAAHAHSELMPIKHNDSFSQVLGNYSENATQHVRVNPAGKNSTEATTAHAIHTISQGEEPVKDPQFHHYDDETNAQPSVNTTSSESLESTELTGSKSHLTRNTEHSLAPHKTHIISQKNASESNADNIQSINSSETEKILRIHSDITNQGNRIPDLMKTGRESAERGVHKVKSEITSQPEVHTLRYNHEEQSASQNTFMHEEGILYAPEKNSQAAAHLHAKDHVQAAQGMHTIKHPQVKEHIQSTEQGVASENSAAINTIDQKSSHQESSANGRSSTYSHINTASEQFLHARESKLKGDAHAFQPLIMKDKSASQISEPSVSHISASERDQGNINELINKTLHLVKAHESDIKIQLRPKELGRMQMHINQNENSINLEIITENLIAKNIIEGYLPELKLALLEHGLNLTKHSIVAGDPKHEQRKENKNHDHHNKKQGKNQKNTKNSRISTSQKIETFTL